MENRREGGGPMLVSLFPLPYIPNLCLFCSKKEEEALRDGGDSVTYTFLNKCLLFLRLSCHFLEVTLSGFSNQKEAFPLLFLLPALTLEQSSSQNSPDSPGWENVSSDVCGSIGHRNSCLLGLKCPAGQEAWSA